MQLLLDTAGQPVRSSLQTGHSASESESHKFKSQQVQVTVVAGRVTASEVEIILYLVERRVEFDQGFLWETEKHSGLWMSVGPALVIEPKKSEGEKASRCYGEGESLLRARERRAAAVERERREPSWSERERRAAAVERERREPS